ncbi:hypothetical protein E4T56_gene1839 [Termitomyces sp. T112]|nr:hypothetical protein E4T56_gene1839 [Termitomyces sp. T112]
MGQQGQRQHQIAPHQQPAQRLTQSVMATAAIDKAAPAPQIDRHGPAEKQQQSPAGQSPRTAQTRRNRRQQQCQPDRAFAPRQQPRHRPATGDGANGSPRPEQRSTPSPWQSPAAKPPATGPTRPSGRLQRGDHAPADLADFRPQRPCRQIEDKAVILAGVDEKLGLIALRHFDIVDMLFQREAPDHLFGREIHIPDLLARFLLGPEFPHMHQHIEVVAGMVPCRQLPPAGQPVDIKRLCITGAQARSSLDRKGRGHFRLQPDLRGIDQPGIAEEHRLLALHRIVEGVEHRITGGRKERRAAGDLTLAGQIERGERTVRTDRHQPFGNRHQPGAARQFDIARKLPLHQIDDIDRGRRRQVEDIGALAIGREREIIDLRADDQAPRKRHFGLELQTVGVIDREHVLPRAAIALGPDRFGHVIEPARRIDRHVGRAAGIDHADYCSVVNVNHSQG